MKNWTDNGTCRVPRLKRIAPDFDRYLPANGGHVVEANGDFDLDEIDAGSQCASALCVQCGRWVGIVLANDIEHTGDETPYVPRDRQTWCALNNLIAKESA